MQRIPRQTPAAVNREKGSSRSGLPNSSPSRRNIRPSNISDFETRIAVAERTNQKILNDISDLKQELHLSKNKFNGTLASLFCFSNFSPYLIIYRSSIEKWS